MIRPKKAILILVLSTALGLSSQCHADVVFSFGNPQINEGGGAYTFDLIVTNNMSTDLIVDSFSIPFELQSGFTFDSIAVNKTSFDSSKLTVVPGFPFHDGLVTANALDASKAAGLRVPMNSTDTLFSFTVISDGTRLNDVGVASLRSPSNFGRFSIREAGADISLATESYASAGISASNGQARLTAVPEPSSALLLGLIAVGLKISVSRRKPTSLRGITRKPQSQKGEQKEGASIQVTILTHR